VDVPLVVADAELARDLGAILRHAAPQRLAHLERAEHGPKFWELVAAYPLAERARGYLMALDHAAGELGVEDY